MKNILFSIVLCLIISTQIIAQVPIYNNFDPTNPNNPNVGLVTAIGAGAAGRDASVLQNTSLGMITLGFGNQIASNNRIADDFILSNSCTLTDISFYAYQTGALITSPPTINDVRVQIWSGIPGGVGSTVIWGDLITNRFSSVSFTNINRVVESDMTNVSRPIQRVVATVNASLAAGTYYVEWSVGGTGISGPWAPPITISGQTVTGNALQHLGVSPGVYNPVNDDGTGTHQQGFPFVIRGSCAPIPTLGQWGLISLMLLLLIFGVVTQKNLIPQPSESKR